MAASPPTKRRSQKLLSRACPSLLVICLLILPACASAQSPAVTFSPGDHDLFIVAHEDDDLLFQSPDLATRLQAGDVVRTVYLTAGDAGLGTVYWQNREEGIQAAYAQMAGARDEWIPFNQPVGDKLIRTYTLDRARNVSVAFLRLPDGNYTTGGGYAVTGYQSLQRLWEGEISTISSLDGTNTYTKEELLQTLVALMVEWGSQHVQTQDSSDLYGWDHPDHRYGARYAFEAHQRYAASGAHHTFTFYRGYNISNEPANLTQTQRDAKWAIFTTYALHDAAICGGTGVSCLLGGDYDNWSYREYSIAQAKDLSGAVSVASGGCLTASPDASGDTVSVFISACAAGADPSTQTWSILGDGALTVPDGRCLEVRGGVSQDVTSIQLAGCTGAPEQRWTAFENGQIRGLGGKCLDVPGSAPENGTAVQLNTCAALSGQEWLLPPVSPQLQENPDFSLAVAPDSSFVATLRAGESATYGLVLTPRAFVGAVVLGCSDLPPGATCTFSPNPVTLEGQNSVNASLTVATTAPARQGPRPFVPGLHSTTIRGLTILLFILLLLGLPIRFSGKRRRAFFLTGTILLAVSLQIACVNGGAGPGGGRVSTETPAGIYAFSIVASSGDLTRSLVVTLKVD